MRPTRAVALTLVSVLGLAACGNGDGNGAGSAVTVGSANFSENVLLAEIYAAALEDAGIDVEKRLNIGSRETYIAGLQDGSIDLIPEYTGGLATYLAENLTATENDEVLQAAEENLPEGLELLEMSEAENKDSLVITRGTSDTLGITTIPDLDGRAGDMVLGGPPEFATRPNGVDGLKSIYGLEFRQFRSLAAGSNLSAQALRNGQVDVANIFTTDPSIEENDFVVLEDPESLFAAQNVVPLISSSVVNDEITEALNTVSAALTTDNLTAMMVEVGSKGVDPATVARNFVDDL